MNEVIIAAVSLVAGFFIGKYGHEIVWDMIKGIFLKITGKDKK